MRKNVMIVFLGILLIGITACNIKTPEIRGVVLDAETKQPVENAWVTATLEVYSKTVAGDVHQSLFVGKTWTDKEGKFLLPSKEFKKPSFPVSFGNKAESLNIGARAVSSKGYISNGIGLKELKKDTEILLYLNPPKDEEYYRLALGGLYDYILTGRLGVSVPPVSEKERLDILDLAIEAYKKFLEIYGDSSNVLRDMGYLYKKRGDYKIALETFKRVKDFDKKHGITLWEKEYEMQINELQQKIKEKKNRLE